MTSPQNKAKKSVRESSFDIVEGLCGHFQGLSPFEVLNADMEDVYNLYVDLVIHSIKNENKGSHEPRQWVTSKTATWH